MTEKDKEVFTLFASRVREVLPDARIWAFGSRVRSEGYEGSDLDVCIVTDRLDEEIDAQIIGIAWQVGYENDVIISTITYSQEEFMDGPCRESPLVNQILNNGVEG